MVAREDLHTVLRQEAHHHMEDLMDPVRMDLRPIELWGAILGQVVHQCLEAQEVTLLVHQEHLLHRGHLALQVDQAQVLVHTVVQLLTYKNFKIQSTQWKKEE